MTDDWAPLAIALRAVLGVVFLYWVTSLIQVLRGKGDDPCPIHYGRISARGPNVVVLIISMAPLVIGLRVYGYIL